MRLKCGEDDEGYKVKIRLDYFARCVCVCVLVAVDVAVTVCVCERARGSLRWMRL